MSVRLFPWKPEQAEGAALLQRSPSGCNSCRMCGQQEEELWWLKEWSLSCKVMFTAPKAVLHSLTLSSLRAGSLPSILFSQKTIKTSFYVNLWRSRHLTKEVGGAIKIENDLIRIFLFVSETADLEEPGVTERDVQESSIRPHQEPRADSDSSTNDIFWLNTGLNKNTVRWCIHWPLGSNKQLSVVPLTSIFSQIFAHLEFEERQTPTPRLPLNLKLHNKSPQGFFRSISAVISQYWSQLLICSVCLRVGRCSQALD